MAAALAVNDVSLAIPRGSIFGLIGRNGAGKTTTIRTIMDIYKPDSGEILYNGAKVDRRFRDHVGYLPEERGLYPKMKVLDALMFFAEIKGMVTADAKQTALRSLARFGLADRANDKIETLSKGNQQKVQFIAAIIHDPDVVILDEPFSGLDPVNTSLMIDMIEELRDQNKAILFSTHIMEFAERMCDHIALIDQGAVILDGSLGEIKQRHGTSHVSVVSDDDLGFLTGLPFVTSTQPNGNALSVDLTDSRKTRELLSALVAHNVDVTRFDATPVTLHEIFVSLVGHGDEVLAEDAAR